MKSHFWQEKSLEEMNAFEWESLCDGCGQCCLVKLEDEETAEVYLTNAACQLLDIESCRCLDYEHRLEKVPGCALMTRENLQQYEWLPETCAYRLLYEGKELLSWHPLLSGHAESVHEEGISVRDFAQSEEYIHPDQLYQHVIGKI